jgi:membrane protease YdiL (CAAX protease family)
MAGMRVGVHLRDILELVFVYGLIIAVIWTPMPAQRILFWIVFVSIITITALRGESLRTMGLAADGFWRSLWIVLAALVLSGVAILVAAQAGTLHPLFGRNMPLGLRIGGYTVWAFLQEFIMQVYVLLRLLRLLSNRTTAILLAALLFAIAHIPNPVLTGLTLLWGLIACTLYLRYRNLYTLGVAHAVLGICVAVTVPDSVHHHMRVGVGYLTYRQNTHVWASHLHRSAQ